MIKRIVNVSFDVCGALTFRKSYWESITVKISITGTIDSVLLSMAWKYRSHQSIRIRPMLSTWYRISSTIIRFCVALDNSLMISSRS